MSDLETYDSNDAISSSVGYPVNEHIFYIWSMVQLPANKGFCASTSQMMQPKLQISAGVEQDFEPSSTSGDLYQRVATPSVRTAARSLRVRERTSPKSQSLMAQLELTSMLEGLRSLWMILPECRYLRDLAIWQMMKRVWTSLRMPSAMTLCRSASMYSNSRQTSLLLSARMVSCSLMMLGWSNCRRISISRQVRCASVACWKASKIFFSANTFFVAFSYTFHTWPQAPEPTFFSTLKRRRMCDQRKFALDWEDILASSFQFYIIWVSQDENSWAGPRTAVMGIAVLD